MVDFAFEPSWHHPANDEPFDPVARVPELPHPAWQQRAALELVSVFPLHVLPPP